MSFYLRINKSVHAWADEMMHARNLVQKRGHMAKTA